MKRSGLIILTLLISISGYSQKLRLTNHWLPQSQFAGMYVAKEMGFYKEAGLDVEISHASAIKSAVSSLLEGETDIITQFLTTAMSLDSSGNELVNIFQMSNQASLMLVMREPIDNIQNLKGKKIGTWSAGFDEPVKIFEAQNNLEFQWIPYLFDVIMFIIGAIDGTICMEYNEYYGLLSSGYELTEKHYIRFPDIGIDVPEDGLYVKKEFYEENKELLAKFVEQTRRGWEWARENRKETVDIVMNYANRISSVNNRKHQTYMLNVVLDKQANPKTGEIEFKLSKERYDASCQLLMRYGMINSFRQYEDIIKNY